MAGITDVVWEAGFGSTVYTETPTWTDISAYVRSASVSRGRMSSLAKFQPSTGQLVLDNRDGRFNPDNTSGAYSPDVLIGVPIRATITVNVTTYPIFYGYARSWNPSYPKGGDSRVTVQMLDAFGLINLRGIDGNSYALQVTDERIDSVLTDISWPANLRDLDTGVVRMAAADFTDQDALTGRFSHSAYAHMQDCVDAEVGALFMSADNKVTFRNRVTNSGDAPASTFDDSEISELVMAYNDDFLWNDVRVSRNGGTQQSATNATSITNHGRRVLTKFGAPVADDTDALNTATWLADVYGDQRVRVESVKLKLYDNVAYMEALLGLELREFITIQHTPDQGDAIDEDCTIEHIRHEMMPGDWTVYLTVSPLDVLESQDYWILGTSELGTDTRLA